MITRVRRTFCLAFTTLAVLITAAAASAQSVTSVSGTLVNSLSQAQVSDATVRLEELAREVRTGASGRFTLVDVPPGKYHLLIRAQGYVEHRSEITVAATPLVVDRGIDPELHFTEVVSVSPDARNQFDSFQATNVLSGQELDKERQGTLGDTLQYQPGVASRSFGPGPARPVIRGLDGDRVLILEDGQRMGDLSSQSGDHGVNVNPGSASRIEVVRGPATLLHGANAIGGLVNVITSDVPTEPLNGAHGAFTVDFGSAARDGGGSAEVTAGNGAVAVHVSGSGRRSGDYSTPDGTVPNSFSRAGFGQVGLSWTGQTGYLGGSFAVDQSHYGIPIVEEGTTNLDPRRRIFSLRGEKRMASGFVSGIRASLGVRRYRHDELDADEVVTSFTNNTSEIELLLNHRGGKRLTGTLGGWAMGRDFSSVGLEALSPPVSQRAVAGFVYQEVAATPHVTVQFGGRLDHTTFTPEEAAPNRSFSNLSGSLGLLAHPTDATTVAVSFARASRNPALEELYNNGPHVGNFAFEVGDANLGSERALGFDLSFRWRATRTSGEVTYFLNSIDDFIYRRPTGDVEDDLPVSVFTAGDARLQGVESHVDIAVGQHVSIEGGVDIVRGELTSGTPLPRMPPLRGRVGLRYQKNAFQTGVDGVFNAMQDRVFGEAGIAETVTDASKLMKLFAAYSFPAGGATHTMTVRLDNATNTLYRNHLNFLKDVTPEVGRNFKLLYSVRF